MKHLIIVASIALAPACANAPAPEAPAAPQLSAEQCGVDLGKHMNLTFDEFDQNLDAGWREIANKPGCQQAGADLIALYRDQQLAQQAAGLDWHEAQLRAAAGETGKALDLFRRNLAFKKANAEDAGAAADVLYGEATIAFLERDRKTLQAKRDALAALPKPDWFEVTAANFRKKFPDAKAVMAWPTNLNVVDGFIACFDKPYTEAYSFNCQPRPPG
ncbi:MAG: hypothetical protein Q8R02_06595 [Hyphomonadaceae bacterium]|nr:hypothetical protein [Hyphomonadaceae bacterium]